MKATALLTPHQRTVIDRVLAEESARREHVVVSLSGAHAYGFPSPDSDFDLKAVHVAAPSTLLGFPREHAAKDRLETIDGVEVDYSSNELGGVLLGALKGNGNYLERFLSGFELRGSAQLDALKPLLQASLSKRVFRHYLGFATQQRQEWEKTGRRSAKKLLYVLRTALTGTEALRHGVIVTDVTTLLERYGLSEALELVRQKTRGEKSELPEALATTWAGRLPEVFATLEKAHAESALPPEPPNADAVEAWLIAERLRMARR